MGSQILQFFRLVGGWLTGKRRLDQPLRNEIGKAPVGSRGVSIPLHCESEMFRRTIFGLIEHIFTSADELHNGQGQIGKSEGVGLPPRDEEGLERTRVRLRG